MKREKGLPSRLVRSDSVSHFLSIAALLAIGQQATVSNLYSSTDGPALFERPAWTSSATFTPGSVGSTASFKLGFTGTPDYMGYQVMVEAFFENDPGEKGMFDDRSVVVVVSGLTYESIPQTGAGQGAVIDRTTYAQLGCASFAWSGSDFTVSYASCLVEDKIPTYVRMYVVPNSFTLTLARCGTLNSVTPITLYETTTSRRRSTEPDIPRGTARNGHLQVACYEPAMAFRKTFCNDTPANYGP